MKSRFPTNRLRPPPTPKVLTTGNHNHSNSDGETKMEKKETKKVEELSQTKKEQLNRQPIVETTCQMSEDKKWFVHKTVITDIKPVTYMEKVLAKA